jgi:16S rRNA (guanine527-N7)-methyltransferase
MEIGSSNWLDNIVRGAAQMGLTVTPGQARQFALHGQSLLEWNRKINLTAITKPEEIAVKHFLDAIAPLDHLPAKGRLLDIGTGGGFPGLPLKVMAPHLSMTLIDGVRKKINFVKHVIRQLGLQDVQALHLRAEELAQDRGSAGGFEIIVCRALADLDKLLDLAVPLLAPQGRIIAYQGPRQGGPTSGGADGAILTHGSRRFQTAVHAYHLPFIGDPRSITELQQVGWAAPTK